MSDRSAAMRSFRWLALAAVVVLSALSPAGPGPRVAAAAACSLVPVLRDSTVNQGLSGYTNLARGKGTLVRLYLSLPGCAVSGQSIQITAASLVAKAGSTTIGTIGAPVNPLIAPLPKIATYAAAPAIDSTGDPKFFLPGALLAPSAVPGSYDATFTATISSKYRSSATATPVAGPDVQFVISRASGGDRPLTFHKTEALRILVVRMMDMRRNPTTPQFRTEAVAAVASGFQAASRILPVPNGTCSPLPCTTGGIRYSKIGGGSILDLTTVPGAFSTTTGDFCGTQSNFDTLKSQLEGYRNAWNSANATANGAVNVEASAYADRVLGVVDSAFSRGSSDGCAEGMAAFGGTAAWVRAIPPLTGPSMTGGLMALELSHTVGLVPTRRSGNYHSYNLQADGGTNRGYNLALRSYLSDDRSVMRLDTTYGPWNDDNTLLEPEDQAVFMCKLGGPLVTDCPVPGTVGTGIGVGAGPKFLVAGKTDGTAAGTKVVESYFATDGLLSEEDPSSEYRFVQRSATAILRDFGFRVSFGGSAHDHDDGTVPSTESPTGVFSVSAPFELDATRIEIWKGTPDATGSVLLYSRDKTAPPVLSSATQLSAGPPLNYTSSAASERQPSLSPDGQWVAWLAPCDGRPSAGTCTTGDLTAYVAPVTDASLARAVPAVIQGGSVAELRGDAPSWRPDGGAVVLAAGNDLYVQPVDTTAQTATFGTPTRVFDNATLGMPFAASMPVWSGDGTKIAFEIGEQLYRVNVSNGAVTQLTFGADIPAYPSFSPVSGDTRMAFVQRPRTPATTERINVSTSGSEATGLGYGVAISGDGRFVAFATVDALVGDDTNATTDVYVRDRTTRLTERVSLTDGDAEANGSSDTPSISNDGRYVAFRSNAYNLYPGTGPYNGNNHIYVRDRLTGQTELVSVSVAGQPPNGDSDRPQISADGNVIAFSSVASDIIAGDTNDGSDVFAFNRTSGMTTHVNVVDGTSGRVGLEAFRPSVSATGRYVAFLSRDASHRYYEQQAYVRDLQAGIAELVSVSTSQTFGDLWSHEVDISGDGRYVAFNSDATNLVVGDDTGWLDVFVRDRVSGTTVRANVAVSGAQSAGEAVAVSISGDGRVVIFASSATDLTANAGANGMASDVFARNLVAGTTELLSVSSEGTLGDSHSGSWYGTSCCTDLSLDGRHAAFVSSATNLVSADTNNEMDVFVRERASVTIPPGEVWTMDTAAPTTTLQRRATGAASVDWGNPNRMVIQGTDGDLFTMTPTGTSVRRVTDGGGNVSPSLAGDLVAFEHRFANDTSDIQLLNLTQRSVVAQVQDAQTENVRASVLFMCNGIGYPIAVGVPLESLTGGAAALAVGFDITTACDGQPGTFRVVVNDGFLTDTADAPPPVDDPPVVTRSAPVAALSSPANGSRFLQYETLVFTGAGIDQEDGTQPGSRLEWSLTPPGGTASVVGFGQSLSVEPPTIGGGWAPGTYMVTLRVTDADGMVSELVTRTITIAADADNDGLTNAQEAASCFTGDADPYEDADGDGIPNGDEIALGTDPCAAQSPVTDPQADTTAPTLAVTIDHPTPTGPAQVSLTASDAGTGLRAVVCKIDDGSGPVTAELPQLSYGAPTYAATFELTAPGSYTVDCAASDLAYNRTVVSRSVVIEAGAVDSQSPTVTVTHLAGDSGWNTTAPAVVEVQASDPDGTIASVSCTKDVGNGPVAVTVPPVDGSATYSGSFQIMREGVTPVACSVTDAAGHEASAADTVRIDLTDPVVQCPAKPPNILLRATGATVTATVTDAGSGPLATPVSVPVSTATVGKLTVPVTGTDVAGRTATVDCRFNVRYAFSGFLTPTKNPPGLNTIRAGSTYQLTWRLADAAGKTIKRLAAVIAVTAKRSADCVFPVAVTGAPAAVAASPLRYDAANLWYVFDWKTSSTPGCYQFNLYLDDGSIRKARFKTT